ncbi:MAG: hypothetical protein ABIM89_08970 [Mycobacteriales bacterium]
MDGPERPKDGSRTFSGKVTAVIIVAIVLVFVTLNIVAEKVVR